AFRNSSHAAGLRPDQRMPVSEEPRSRFRRSSEQRGPSFSRDSALPYLRASRSPSIYEELTASNRRDRLTDEEDLSNWLAKVLAPRFKGPQCTDFLGWVARGRLRSFKPLGPNA